MPAHNEARYLASSIESILNQTLGDFEFVILDDASDDETWRVLEDWARRDRRIRLLQSRERLGLVGSSNAVVRAARAPVCARMDADDVAHPERLMRQWEVLSSGEDVILVGTLWEGIDKGGRHVRPRDRWRLVRGSAFAPFAHGSIMFRREVFWRVGGYRPACVFWEDFDLYTRMAERGRVLVIPEALYRYRFHTRSTRLSAPRESLETALDLMRRCVALRRMGRDYSSVLEGASGRTTPRDTVSAHLLFALGWGRLWAGQPPEIVRELRHLAVGPWDAASLKVILLGLSGGLSPSALRLGLCGFIRLRDRVAGWVLGDRAAVEWRSG